MKIIKSFFLIINLRTLFAVAVSVLSVWLCLRFGIKAEFPLYLISIAIVFPIVFSIDSAYKRREHALQFYGDLKGHALSLYFAVRDWVDPLGHSEAAAVKKELSEIFREISTLFMKPPAEAKAIEADVFHRMSALSRRILAYKKMGLEGGEVSRLHQYVSKMLVAYNIVRNVFFYRTPITLRAYSKIFIYFFPVLYGPYAASTYEDYSFGIAYFFAILYSVILVSLDNLQEHLENPFDQVGEDDIDFEVEALIKAME
jgi:predicted membrane chloride channel (bestrophin family)